MQPVPNQPELNQNFFATRKAAKLLGCTPDYIGKLCREAKLKGELREGAWWVDPSSIAAYQLKRDEDRAQRGRELAELRRRETKEFQYANSNAAQRLILRARESAAVAGTSVALGLALVVGSAAVAHALPGINPAAQSAALAHVDSPFFGTGIPKVSIADFAGGVENFFASLFAPNSAQPQVAANTPMVPAIQTPAPNAAAPTATVVQNTYPVTERVIEHTTTNTVSGITQADLTGQLQALANSLRSQLYGALSTNSSATPAQSGFTGQIALSQRIDNLSGVTITGGSITGASISGGSLSGVSLNPGDLSGVVAIAHGGTATSTAPNYGQLLVGDGAGGYQLLATSSLGIGTSANAGGSSGQVQYNNGGALAGTAGFEFDSTSGVLSVAGASSTNATSTNATSTSAYAANFVAVNATTTNVSATNASTTNLTVSSLGGSAGQCLTVNSSGTVTTTTCGSGSTFAWTPTTNYGAATNATTSVIWFQNGLQASSTSQIAYASSTALSVSGALYTPVTSSLLKTDSSGKVVAALAGTDYQAAGNYATFGYLFPANATSTLLTFSGGLTVSGGTLTVGSLNGPLQANNGVVSATTSIGVLYGGTGSTTLGGILTGNGTGQVTSAAVAAPLSFSGNTLSISQASGSTNGYLSSTDWSTFNNKISSTSLSAGAGISYDSSTGIIANTIGYPFPSNATTTQLAFNGGATFAGATTTALAVTGSSTISSVFNSIFANNLASTTLLGNTLLTNATTTAFAITGAGTTTAANGFNISAGCFAVNGTCLTSGGSSFGYPFVGNATTTQLAFNGGATFAGATSTALAVTGSSTISSILNIGGLLNANGGATTTGLTVTGTASTTNLVVSSLGGSGTTCVQADASGVLSSTGAACGTGSGAVNSVSNSDGTLTVSPTTGAVVASLNLGHANTWSALQQFNGNASTTQLTVHTNLFATDITATGTLAVSGLTTLSNLLLTGSSTLQNFTALNATTSAATTTALAISGISSGNLLKTTTGGAVVAAVAGTDYQAAGNYATFGYLFPSNATTTQLAFNGGLTAVGATSTALAVTGSSTISSVLNVGGTLNSSGISNTGNITTAGQYQVSGSAVISSTRIFTAANGAQSAPSYAFLSNLTTGLYLPASGILGVTAGGSEVARFNGTGLGVGSTSPFAALSVHANSNSTNTTLFAIGSSTASATSTLFSVSNTGSTTLFQIPSSILKTNANGTIVAAVAGTDYLTSTGLSATFPLAYNSGTGAFTFNGLSTSTDAVVGNIPYFSSANTFANVATSSPTAGIGISLSGTGSVVGGSLTITNSIGYPFPSNATSTKIDFNGGLTAVGATTTALAVTGSSTISSILNVGGALNANGGLAILGTTTSNNGFDISAGCYAIGGNCVSLSSFGGILAVTNGGTGSSTLTGLLKGNGTGAVQTAVGGTDYEVPLTFNAPLTRSTNSISITQSGLAANGYLSSTDFNTFNNKISSTSLSGASVISYNSGTGVITTTAGTFGGSASSVYTFPGDLIVTGNATTTNATTTSLYVSGTVAGAGLSTCNSSADKLLWNGGVFTCGTDAGSSGSSEINWTYFNGSGVRVSTSSNQVLIGFTSTSSLSQLEVHGGETVDNATTTSLYASGNADFNGNVGLGTTTPSEKLAVNGGNILQVASGAGSIAATVATTSTTHSRASVVSGNYLYSADYEAGLRIIDISNPKAPVAVGSYNTSMTHARAVAVAGKYAYVGDDTSGLVILDVSKPAAPALVGSVSAVAYGVALSGRYAYVTDNSAGLLRVIDVSNPANPVQVGSVQPNALSQLYAIAVQGKYAFVGDYGTSNIYAIDISNPTAPAVVGTLLTNSPTGFYISGKYLYDADHGGGLYVVNISDPTSPAVVGHVANGSAYDSVSVAGSYAYVANSAGSQLVVYDVSNAASPASVGTLALGDTPFGVSVAGKYAYVAANGNSEKVIDINGASLPAATIGSLAAGAANIADNLTVGGDIYAGGGLNVGLSGIFSRGGLAAQGSTTLGATLSVTGSTTLASVLNVGGLANLNGGLTAYASSTIGNGTQTGGLTISGGATTTGNAYFAGSVGIGTKTPASSLQVQNGDIQIGTVGFGIVGTRTDGSTGRIIGVRDTAGTYMLQDATLITSIGGNAIQLLPNGGGVNGVTISSVGNVGIGTTSPFAKLSIAANNGDTNTTLFAVGSSTASATTTLFSVSNTGTINTNLNSATSTLFTFGGRSLLIASTTSGSTGGNLGLGLDDLSQITSGSFNTAVGYQTLSSLTTNSSNTALGYQAGTLTTADSNTFVGYKAGSVNTAGSQNAFVGSQSGNANTTGSSNAALGFNALSDNTTGNTNVGIGLSASLGNLSATNTVAIGAFAANGGSGFTFHGQGYTAVGYDAGASFGTVGQNGVSAGDYNTLFGYRAGSQITTGYANVLVGPSVTGNGNNLTTGHGNVGLGNELFFPTASTNNSLNIGNLLFGTLPATSTGFALPTTGAIGVGTSSPFAKLSIAANNGDTTKILFAIGSSTASATSTLFSISNTGSTTLFQIPSSILKTDANGTIVAAVAGSDYSNFAFPFTVNTGYNSTTSPLGLFASTTIGAGGQTTGLTVSGGATTTGTLIVGTQANNTSFSTDSSGFLNIIPSGGRTLLQGTSAGTVSTLVNENTTGGSGTGSGFLFASGGATSYIGGVASTRSDTSSNSLTSFRVLANGVLSNVDTTAVFYLQGLSSGGANAVFNSSVGVGTTSPYAQLSVFAGGDYAAHAASTLFAIGSSTAGTATSTFLTVLSSGNVGIGTVNSGYPLEVDGSGTSKGVAGVINSVSSAGIPTIDLLTPNLATGGDDWFTLGKANSAYNSATIGFHYVGNANPNNYIEFNLNQQPGITPLIVNGGGNVGISSTSPYARFAIQANNGDTNPTLFAIGSSTASATTTLFSISNTGSTTLASTFGTCNTTNALTTNSSGTIVCGAVSAAFAASSTLLADFNTFTNLQKFNGGFIAAASSTIGAGGQTTGLTISGGATTTGNAYFAGKVGIGTTSPNWSLQIASTTPYIALTDTDAPANTKSYVLSSLNGLFQIGLADDSLATTSDLVIDNGSGNFGVFTTFPGNSGAGALFNIGIGNQALTSLTTGDDNVGLGERALTNNLTGLANVAIGLNASQNNSSATNTVAIGKNAANGGGSFNAQGYTVVGALAGAAVLTGADYNTLFGYQAGSSVTSGYSNLLVGPSVTAGNLTTGHGNVGLGNELFFPTASTNNSLNIGNFIYGTLPATSTAFKLPTTGSLGVGTSSPYAKFSIAANNGDTATTLFAIGSSTASATTTLFSVSSTGTINVNLDSSTSTLLTLGGQTTLTISSTGTRNTGLGIGALANNSSGLNNVAVGYAALSLTTSAGQNTAIGTQALQNNVGGSNNTGIGDLSLQHNISGTNNAALGDSSLAANTTGIRNTALGSAALLSNTTGSYNVAVGYLANTMGVGTSTTILGAFADVGSDNLSTSTAIGAGAIVSCSNCLVLGGTGQNAVNVGIGKASPAFTLDVNGIANVNGTTGYFAIDGNRTLYASSTTHSVQVGFGAGNTTNVNAAYNSILGYNAGNNITSGANNVLLGGYSTGSNSNLTSGSNNVSIGYNISLPSATNNNQLDIQNILYGTGNSGSGSTVSTGNLGVATTTPWARLSVDTSSLAAGVPEFAVGSSTRTDLTITQAGNIGVGTTNPVGMLHIAGGANPATQYFTNNTTGNTAADGLEVGNSATDGSAFIWQYENSYLRFATNNTERMRIDATGNVGIGTTSPWAKLSVQKDYGETNNTLFAIGSSTAADGSTADTWFTVDNTGATSFGNAAGTGDANFQFGSDANAWSVGYYSADKTFRIASSTDLASNVALSIAKGGNFGVGTTSPYAQLSVFAGGDYAAHAASTLFAIGSSTAGRATSTLFMVNSAGNVGIGTTTPGNFGVLGASLLTVGYTSGTAAGLTIANTTSNSYSQLALAGTGKQYQVGVGNAGETLFGVANKFFVYDNQAIAMRMVIDTNGLIGIGTTSPTALLALAGSGDERITLDSTDTSGGNFTGLQLTNKGVFKGGLFMNNSTNDIALWNGGPTQVLTVKQSSGNVGIGTTSPGALLDLFGGNHSAGDLYLGPWDAASSYNEINLNGLTGAGNYNFLSSYADQNLYINRPLGANIEFGENNSSNQLFLKSGGNVGIGTTSPALPLSVQYSDNNFNSGIAVTNTNSGVNAWGGVQVVNNIGTVGLWAMGGSNLGAVQVPLANQGLVESQTGMVFMADNNTATGGTDGMYFITGGYNTAPTMTLTAGNPGKVGIGTKNPTGNLQVEGGSFNSIVASSTDSIGPGLALTNAGTSGREYAIVSTGSGSSAGAGKLLFRDDTGGNNRMVIDSSGNVGVGTTTPAAKLDVYGGTTEGLHINNTNEAPFGLMINNNTFGTGDTKGFGFFQSNAGLSQIYNNNVRAISFDTSGNVSIGTTNSSDANGANALTIQGASNTDALNITNGTNSMGFFTVTTGNIHTEIGSLSNNNFGFFTNNATPQFTLDTGGGASLGTYAHDAGYVAPPANGLIVSGTVGIGTTSPFAQLSVFAGGDYAAHAASTLFAIGSTTAGTATSTFLVVNSAGNVGIGTTSPSQPLSVTGKVYTTGGIQFSDGTVQTTAATAGYVEHLVAIYSNGTAQSNQTVQLGTAANASGSFTGTLTLPATTTRFVVEVWGGGGGGGAANSVGAAGGTGGTSCFGTNATACTSPLLQATGGVGGTNPGGNVGTPGGAGGVGTLGDINFTGQAGTGGDSFDLTDNIGGPGGAGGSAPRGGGGGATGTVGSAFGGGGGGATATAGGAPGGGGGGGYSEKLITGVSGVTYHYTTGSAGTASTGGTAGAAGGTGGIVITAYATSSPNSAGNDYAEMFPVSAPGIGAGDIVAVDAGQPVSMKLAQKGDKALAGAVSTAPGQTLGDINASGMRPIALQGRVPVKVNLENGPINIGDRIAISSVPGVGMRAGPFDSSVGIALESYDGTTADASGIGKVMMMIDIEQGVDAAAVGDALLGPALSAPAVGSTTATSTATSTPGVVTSFMSSLFARITNWLADKGNGILNLFAATITATTVNAQTVNTQTLCIGKTCVTETELQALLGGQAAAASSTGATATTTAPIISVNGNNPASVPVGTTYADLGATITGPTADLNLGIMAAVDGGTPRTLDQIYIDTSAPGAHTIIYSATDQNGVIGSATRSVVVYDPTAATSTSPTTTTASSTPTTTDTTATTTSTTPSTTDTTASSTPPVIVDTTTSTSTATSTTP